MRWTQQKINNLMYMDDIMIFDKDLNKIENLMQIIRINYKDIGLEYGIEKYVMLLMKKRKKRNNRMNRTSPKYKYWGILEELDE